MRNQLALSIVLLALLALLADGAEAQIYPSRPIRLVVPFAPGGTADINARAVAAQVERQLGGSIVIDNRDGANGIIGTQIVVHAAPDGHTLLHTTTSIAINPAVHRKLPYDTLKDLEPVTFVALGSGYVVVASPAFNARSMSDLIELAKKDRNKPLAYGSAGIGNSTHLVTEMFNRAAGVTMTHVPYKGVAPALNAVIAGEVQFMFIPPTAAVQHIKSGLLRALAFTGKTRWSVLPDVPTVMESGLPGFHKDAGWNAWFAPAKTPAAIIARLQQEVRAALAVPKVHTVFTSGGYDPLANTPAEAREFMRAEVKAYGDIVRAIRLEEGQGSVSLDELVPVSLAAVLPYVLSNHWVRGNGPRFPQ
jgi:tripartite-type tricarboxylate transporter receptor subunit TctC